MILTTMCLAVSATAIKVQVKTEDVFDDIGDWFEGAWFDYLEWMNSDVFGNDRLCKSSAGHRLGEFIPGKGYSSTYEVNLKLREKTDDVNRDYYSVFGHNNGEYRITE